MEVPTIYKAYFSGLWEYSPQNMARNMVLTYLHFRILKFPLIYMGVRKLGATPHIHPYPPPDGLRRSPADGSNQWKFQPTRTYKYNYKICAICMYVYIYIVYKYICIYSMYI